MRYWLGVFALLIAIAFASTALILIASEPKPGDKAAQTRSAEKAGMWHVKYSEAIDLAKVNHKVVLADFTGSDWCHYCITLKEEVLDTDDFKNWAQQHVVLLMVDFPQNTPQSDEIKDQNQKLAAQFNIEGYPTILVLDTQGQEIGRIVGYPDKDSWQTQLHDLMAKVKKG